MTNATLSLNTDSIQYQVRKTAGELYAGAENVRIIAAALGDRVGELPATAGPEALRQVAATAENDRTSQSHKAAPPTLLASASSWAWRSSVSLILFSSS